MNLILDWARWGVVFMSYVFMSISRFESWMKEGEPAQTSGTWGNSSSLRGEQKPHFPQKSVTVFPALSRAAVPQAAGRW